MAEAALVYSVVSDLEEVLQVGDSQLLTSHESPLSQLELPLQFDHRCLHLLLGQLQRPAIDWFLLLDALVDLKEDGPEQCGAEAVLVPGEMLVDQCPLLDVAAVVGSELRVLLAKIGEDGVAFGQLEVSMGNEGDLSERVHGQVLLGPGLIIANVHCDCLMGDLTDVKQALDSASGLTGYVPIQGKAHYQISNYRSQCVGGHQQQLLRRIFQIKPFRH